MNEATRQLCGLTPSNTVRIDAVLAGGVEPLEDEQDGVRRLGVEPCVESAQALDQFGEPFEPFHFPGRTDPGTGVPLGEMRRRAWCDP